jgi:RimJ/RimL family protein N-acetyltransferase
MVNADLTAQHIVLENQSARLEPLDREHFEALCTIAMDKDIWQFTSSRIETVADFHHYFDQALNERKAGLSYPFALIDKYTGNIAGCSRYGGIQLQHKRLEIGWTWIDRGVRGTGFNKACKFLLLSHGFEQLGLNRIELKTSSLNLVSQKAIEKIGGVREGLFRRHMINPDGTVRDTIYYSLICEDWEATRSNYFAAFI